MLHNGYIKNKNMFRRVLISLLVLKLCNYGNAGNKYILEMQDEKSNKLLIDTKQQCLEPSTLVITGESIKFSVFINKDGSIRNVCKHFTMIRYLEVFASNAVSIDQDLLAEGAQLQVSIVAPVWEVVGIRRIRLDGAKGNPHKRAESGQDLLNPDGEDGVQGNPGGTGGNFLGIAEIVLKGEHLTISTNGGDGGIGQDAGHGMDGVKQNISIRLPIYCSCYEDFLCDNGTITAFSTEGKYEHFTCQLKSYSVIPLRSSLFYRYPQAKERFVYSVTSEKATNGGNGGKGGKGGKVGIPGSIQIIVLNESSKYLGILTQNSSGKIGEAGKGGLAGKAAKKGLTMVYEKICYTNARKIRIAISETRCITRKTTDWLSKPGSKGTDGASSKESIDPVKPNVLEKATIRNLIMKYKKFLMKIPHHILIETHVHDFLKVIDGNNFIKRLYSNLDFMDDFISLEYEFRNPKRSIYVYLRPFYQSFLNRLTEYVQTFNGRMGKDQEIKMISYLYTATLGRIYIMKNQSEFDVVIDVNKYATSITSKIEKTNENKFSSDTIDLLSGFHNNYSHFTYNKLVITESVVQNQLNTISDYLDSCTVDNVNFMIAGLISLKNKTKTDAELFKGAKEKLIEALVLKSFESIFNNLGNTLQLALIIGKAAFAVIQKTSLVIETLSLSTLPSIPEITEVRTALKFAKTKFVLMVNEQKEVLKRALYEVGEEVKKHSKPYDNLLSFITNITARLERSKSLTEIKEIEYEIGHQLASNGDTNLYEITKFANISISFIDFVNVVKNDKARLIIFNTAVKEADIIIRKFVKNTYSTSSLVDLFFEKNTKEMHSFANKLGKNTEISFDLGYLQIRNTLKNLSLFVTHIRKEPSAKGFVIKTSETLEASVTLLTNLFGHLNNYQELKRLANFHEDVSSESAIGIDVSEDIIRNASTFLETTITSNLILQHYKIIYDTSVSLTFPLGFIYLDGTVVPTHIFYFDDSIESFVFRVLNNINIILEHQQYYKRTIKYVNNFVMDTSFGIEGTSAMGPFFTWPREGNKEMISSLLSGKEVIANANIIKSVLKGYAITFKSLGFYFKTTNESIQQLLDLVLENFRVDAVHIGYSYYKYNHKHYIISAQSLSITYCFKKEDDYDELIQKCTRNAYKEFDNELLHFSPYTTWKVKLLGLSANTSFSKLETFKEHVELLLVGEGLFFSESISKSLDLKVDSYYRHLHNN